MPVTVAEFEVADPPDSWTRAGFDVDSELGGRPVDPLGQFFGDRTSPVKPAVQPGHGSPRFGITRSGCRSRRP
jgi:hypothetical protein